MLFIVSFLYFIFNIIKMVFLCCTSGMPYDVLLMPKINVTIYKSFISERVGDE